MKNINLNQLGNRWLELKKQRMQNLLKIALPDEAMYGKKQIRRRKKGVKND
jgi:hypothetical protein